MFQIGVFARLGQVSVQTLRFYGERELIKPARTDPQTGYRYYHGDQVSRLLQILALRDLDFSLDKIAIARRIVFYAPRAHGLIRLVYPVTASLL